MWNNIRKFGLGYCDLPTMLWNVSVFLRLLTLNIDRDYTKGIPMVFYIITSLACSSYFYVYLVSMVWFVFVRSVQTGQMVEAMVVLSLGVSSEIGILKLLNMFLYIGKIRKLTADFLDFDSRRTPGSRLSTNLLRNLRDVKKRAIIYWMVIMGNALLYVMKPLLTPGKHLSPDWLIIYGLEPMFDSPNFEIATIMMTSSVLLICYISATVTSYLIVITGYAESQLLALSEEVSHVWEDAEIHYQNVIKNETADASEDREQRHKIMNAHVSQSLRGIITQHAIIKHFFWRIEDVFRGALGAGLFLLILGIISELLGGLENTYLQLPFAFIQVGMDCLTGQRIMEASIIFEEAVYGCKWEMFDKDNMKMVLMMLQSAQKTIALSAGGLIKMSFRCLMSTMRATYSTYTAFRSNIE